MTWVEETTSDSPARRALAWALRACVACLAVGVCSACGQPAAARTVWKPLPEALPSRQDSRVAERDVPEVPAEPPPEAAPEVAPTPAQPPPPAPVAGPGELLVFRDGEPVASLARNEAEAAGLFVLDVGSAWVPPLFRSTPERPHSYEPVFVALANGRFDDSTEGRRASRERYLEPHGIPPSPWLLEQRFTALVDNPCSSQLALEPLQAFEGIAWDEGTPPPSISESVVTALQTRLACEGHLRAPPSGVLDEHTRAALEEFERRNRIYARGRLQGPTLEALRAEPLELERRALVRVLTERMVLDLGVIEDGSALRATSAREPTRVENAPDLVRQIEQRIVAAFGLESVAGVQAFYGRLADAFTSPHAAVAIDSIQLPSYYDDDMLLWVEIDRGDLYYEFPFDAQGKPLGFRIERGPTLTLFARDRDRALPLVQYPTTIGGWRVRRHGDQVVWEYKESRPGLRAWKRIVAAPVWLPPASTPWETLVVKFRRTSDGSEFYELNRNLVGPSFASAYGLVAAYHQSVVGNQGGVLELGRDDGMRTHGSSDYTSIWRSVSSGCHRLHNHVAMRLLNFVLAHRSHRRIGERPMSYRLPVHAPGFDDVVEVTRNGYEFELERPIEVHVLPGRIRGEIKRPIRRRFPAPADEASWPTIVVTPTPGPS